ncbi:MAG: membrane-bound lytic murein transglycosylase D [Myxococcota bacterium]|jgi:membrane-bound lytic murein transglycosylase D
MFNRACVVSLAVSLALSAPAFASPEAQSGDAQTRADSTTSKPVKPGLFPRMRARSKARRAERSEQRASRGGAVAAGPDADAPAGEAPDGGIWEWVERMDGEIPTEAQEEAIVAHQEEEAAQTAASDVDITKSNHPLLLDLVDPDEFDIPIEITPEVEKWVAYFTGSGRKYYQRWLSRSTRFRPMMYEGLERKGLPRDLVYLSMIESGYNAHAYSHASAAGLWQFIPSTAKLYDLRVDYWVDERRDPEASLNAAMAFLGELHTMFGDWRLAWAAYNGGPGRVRRAVRDSGSKDFWTLARGTFLHSETDNYVPKIMAAAIIGHHPERYGFTDIEYQDRLEYDSVKVEGSVALDVLARCAGAGLDEMKALNPHLRRYSTPPEGAMVRLPVGRETTFVAELAKVPKAALVTVERHTVKRGETLSVIAGRYGANVASVTRANNLRSADKIYVGMSLVIPRDGSSPAASSRSVAKAPVASSASKPKATTHTVRSGDTLTAISGRYGVSVSQLRSWNGLSGEKILVGQRLRLTSSGASSSSSSASATTKYTVRTGDTLSGIATKLGVRTSDLQRWNNITNASHIRIGQVLSVRGGSAPASSSWRTYEVRRGDSLGRIATANGCSVHDLMSWNGLKTSVIQPGQKIRIQRG